MNPNDVNTIVDPDDCPPPPSTIQEYWWDGEILEDLDESVPPNSPKKESKKTVLSKKQSNDSKSSSTEATTTTAATANEQETRQYSVSELVQALCVDQDNPTHSNNNNSLPLPLEHRVRDFQFAQRKRREKYGPPKALGIFGLYAHLADIRIDLEWAEDAAWRRQHQEPYLSWTDFDQHNQQVSNRPLFTYTVIAICTLMMIVTLGVNGGLAPLSVNPLLGPTAQTLLDVGARDTALIVDDGQWFRIFTPLILHAGLVHYVINMLAMWFVGGAVERSHGMWNAAMLFFVPAVGGNILSALFLPQYISVGASGGIFGLIGGCFADIAIHWKLLFLKLHSDQQSRWRHTKVILWLLLDIFLNLIIGLTPFVDNFTHLGGFLYGFLCGLSTIERLVNNFFGGITDGKGRMAHIRRLCLRFMGFIISFLVILITTIVLARSGGGNAPSCTGCRYISCVPFPFHTSDKWWYCDDCDFVTADLFKEDRDDAVFYSSIQLHCPSGSVAGVELLDEEISDQDVIRRRLPGYCRDYCDGVFAD